VVVSSWLTDCAAGWVKKECAVIGLAIVVASNAKAAGRPEDQERGRNPFRQPRHDDQRRKEGREQIRVLRQIVRADAEMIVGVIDCAKRGINNERAERDGGRQRAKPPGVSPLSCAESSRASSSPDRCHFWDP